MLCPELIKEALKIYLILYISTFLEGVSLISGYNHPSWKYTMIPWYAEAQNIYDLFLQHQIYSKMQEGVVHRGKETSKNYATIPVQLGPLVIHRTVCSPAQELFGGSLRSTGFYINLSVV